MSPAEVAGGVVTVTLAAALDLTYRLPGGLHPGELHRAATVTRELSGKGVNVAHALAAAGHPVAGVAALGSEALPMLDAGPHAEVFTAVATAGHTRINTTILDGAGATTKVNEAPVPLTRAEWDAVRDLALAEARRIGAEWILLAGTVPQLAGAARPGSLVPVGELLRAARGAGLRVGMDSSDAALAHILDTHLGDVALLKPNTHELAGAVRTPLRTVGEVIAAATTLTRGGVEYVYVSMGSDGALLVTGADTWHAHAPAPAVVNSTGAGDASLAGFLVGLAAGGPERAIATAASWGAHSVAQPRTLLLDPHRAPPARVTADPDPATALREPGLP
ncbi:1-phosphofructokinase family hexose kinase [Pseudactinotalea sp. HY158]|uniref:1-phosphofructokinase family hexose kinase n=1 Tax=Pseudactinotalea sp. HY158 TaxID=2654547 RepID=UPI00129D0E03|nr:PfkB family carbohydrate kinase [Pseudactinotalea sp. HY158]QGH69986.1 1-phosphofructokinase [Pseudactinotalea sp. HY158]